MGLTGPARLRISAGPGRAVTSQDFCGPGRYGPRFQLGRTGPKIYNPGPVPCPSLNCFT